MSDADARAGTAGGAPDEGVPSRSFDLPMPGWRDRFAPLHLALGATFEREMEAGRGFLWLPVLLSIGILVYFALPAEPSLAALGIATTALFVLAWRLRRRVVAFRVALALAAVLAGVTLSTLNRLLKNALAAGFGSVAGGGVGGGSIPARPSLRWFR